MKKLNTEDFITKAKEVHGNKYDYSKAVYIDSLKKVIIICPEHGEFEQLPSSHLVGQGCAKCAGVYGDKPEEFIAKARTIHGDKYDYSKVTYTKNKPKVTIICPEHSEFEQYRKSHLSGSGCPKCAGVYRCNEKEFIEKAKEVHGDKYDYSKAVYINSYSKVIIICSIHGEFEQSPKNHLKGSGCVKCSGRYVYGLIEFIEKAKEVHSDKYDYSKVDYVDTKTKVIIICPEHGEFLQQPSTHLQGQGCDQCGIEKHKLSTEEFIEKAKEVHSDKYDYSKVDYVLNSVNVNIICPIHGEFEQSPHHHLRGNGCRLCGVLKYTLNKSIFIERANIAHNNKYDYSKVDYVNGATKVIIICSIHGEFEQRPLDHLKGVGCNICKSSKGELAIKAILDKHSIEYVQEYRIPEVANILFYDFYLPKHNILIEFHGKQHYEYIPHFHRNGEDDLLAQKNRDDFKKYLVRQFKYRYLEFNFNQLNKKTFEEFEKLIIDNLFLEKRFSMVNPLQEAQVASKEPTKMDYVGISQLVKRKVNSRFG